MAVAKLVAMGTRPNATRTFNVEGTTYSPLDGKIQDWPKGRMDVNLQMIAKIAALCNDAGIEQAGNHYVASGMPTEAALKVHQLVGSNTLCMSKFFLPFLCHKYNRSLENFLVMVEKMGLPGGSGTSSGYRDVLRCCQTWKKLERRIATLQFDRDRKSMGVIVSSSSGRKSLLVKTFPTLYMI
ncbi:Calcium-transporting ATPase 1, endoplasmic reticulum-type [Camellia lanceoleosa]|uniref:Calcium-transporting ATPase 1, endoplasmic reticulum-type n=1 Tax=Camellia lanceoleosa TaxID=1840588 RepID=A0ACC0H343_9ERIC|nr:Calcium-transporting ATPase 1, endoplasmic reticulum-type [Camellia lanceoleosa]